MAVGNKNISSEYGMALNRSKCEALTIGDEETLFFSNGDPIPNSDNTVYLGASLNTSVEPHIELNKRIKSARYTWARLHAFWRDGEGVTFAPQ